MMHKIGYALFALFVFHGPAMASDCRMSAYTLLNGAFSDTAQQSTNFSDPSACQTGFEGPNYDLSDPDGNAFQTLPTGMRYDAEQPGGSIIRPVVSVAGTAWRLDSGDACVGKFEAVAASGKDLRIIYSNSVAHDEQAARMGSRCRDYSYLKNQTGEDVVIWRR